MRSVTYKGLKPASSRASSAARAASRKQDTRCETILRKALWHSGCRYRKNVKRLAGTPDIVFLREKLAIFCDGDFWHGRDWQQRKRKLEKGTNANYWVAKIERNMTRDREQTEALQEEGWAVLRFWESDILNYLDQVVQTIVDTKQRRCQE